VVAYLKSGAEAMMHRTVALCVTPDSESQTTRIKKQKNGAAEAAP
jgi:hypothetical protein